jgi:hypothetical protein
MVNKWKNRYYGVKGLSQKVDQYLLKGPCLEIQGHSGVGDLGPV